MEFEKTAYRFYDGLVARVRVEIKPLVLDLAAEEKKHYELLETLSRDDRLVRQLQQRIKSPPSEQAFGNYVHLPVLPDEPHEDELLNYAESRELIAYEHYGYLAELTPAGPLKELFELLRDEEKGHMRALLKREAVMFSIF